MTYAQWLKQATNILDEAGIGTSRLDALILLEHVLGKDRAQILADSESLISSAQRLELTNLLNRRTSHEPIAFIRGFSEFYGRKFVVNNNVLEPRPESETMIDLLKQLRSDALTAKHSTGHHLHWNDAMDIADVGTGSGALGITAKLELPKCTVDLIDIDPKALKVAKTNVDLFTLQLKLVESILLANATLNYDVLLCNLPYVPDDYHINSSAGFEPRIAIFGGTDGLDVYRLLFEQLKNVDQKPLYILTESLPPQHHDLLNIAIASGYGLLNELDFIQVFYLNA